MIERLAEKALNPHLLPPLIKLVLEYLTYTREEEKRLSYLPTTLADDSDLIERIKASALTKVLFPQRMHFTLDGLFPTIFRIDPLDLPRRRCITTSEQFDPQDPLKWGKCSVPFWSGPGKHYLPVTSDVWFLEHDFLVVDGSQNAPSFCQERQEEHLAIATFTSGNHTYYALTIQFEGAFHIDETLLGQGSEGSDALHFYFPFEKSTPQGVQHWVMTQNNYTYKTNQFTYQRLEPPKTANPEPPKKSDCVIL